MRKTLRSPDYARLIDLLIAVRKDAGVTQQLLADRLRKPQSFVAKIEAGERRIDVLEFLEIVRTLGYDPLDILGRFLRSHARRKA